MQTSTRGLDGKLYIGNWNGLGGQMSVIDSPDNKGAAAGFCRKCLRFPGYVDNGELRYVGVSIPPCMPNYSLGPANPVCYPTGVGMPEVREAAFLLHPNPSRGIIEVKSHEAGTLRLYDVTGSVVSSTLLSRAGVSISIDISALAPGMYQYKFIGKSGQGKAGKLIVEQ